MITVIPTGPTLYCSSSRLYKKTQSIPSALWIRPNIICAACEKRKPMLLFKVNLLRTVSVCVALYISILVKALQRKTINKMLVLVSAGYWCSHGDHRHHSTVISNRLLQDSECSLSLSIERLHVKEEPRWRLLWQPLLDGLHLLRLNEKDFI